MCQNREKEVGTEHSTEAQRHRGTERQGERRVESESESQETSNGQSWSRRRTGSAASVGVGTIAKAAGVDEEMRYECVVAKRDVVVRWGEGLLTMFVWFLLESSIFEAEEESPG